MSRRRPGRPGTATLLAALVVVAVLGCAPDPAGRLFRTTVAAPDGSYPQEIVLGDQTGLVRGIEPLAWDAAGGFDPPTVVNSTGDDTELEFRWANGACDRPAISFSRRGDRFDLRVDFREKLGSCMAVLLFRAIRIRTFELIPADHVDVCCPR